MSRHSDDVNVLLARAVESHTFLIRSAGMLEYENILFINDHPKAEIKLIDFGLSKKFGKDELTEGVGTM